MPVGRPGARDIRFPHKVNLRLRHAEEARGKTLRRARIVLLVGVAQGGRCADTNHLVRLPSGQGAHAPDETGNFSTHGAGIRVRLVEHEVAQRCAGEQYHIGPGGQDFQLTVVRDQDPGARALALLRLNAGSIIALDRAYNDFAQFSRWSEAGAWFVTRMNEGTVYDLVQARETPQRRNIRSDEIIRLSGAGTWAKCPHLLRRIVVWDEEYQREIVLRTNHMDFGATTIADIYKERWQIEVFFKTLKQNLKIKTFVGTTENALRIQIWTALIALCLLKWLHHLSQTRWSLSNLAYLVRLNLFTYRDLRDWLNDPYNTPPIIPFPEQLELPLTGLGQGTSPHRRKTANLVPINAIQKGKTLIIAT